MPDGELGLDRGWFGLIGREFGLYDVRVIGFSALCRRPGARSLRQGNDAVVGAGRARPTRLPGLGLALQCQPGCLEQRSARGQNPVPRVVVLRRRRLCSPGHYRIARALLVTLQLARLLPLNDPCRYRCGRRL
ncbi:MAG: hypothetical protein MJE77_06285 [Proteobacteria bacterium]|nr:hypothetical protein [Pseudomonadota bacterium]